MLTQHSLRAEDTKSTISFDAPTLLGEGHVHTYFSPSLLVSHSSHPCFWSQFAPQNSHPAPFLPDSLQLKPHAHLSGYCSVLSLPPEGRLHQSRDCTHLVLSLVAGPWHTVGAWKVLFGWLDGLLLQTQCQGI